MATTVAFGSNLVVDEGGGNAYLVVNRTGDLSMTTVVIVSENWANSTVEEGEDLIFNWYVASSSVFYNEDTKNITLIFAPGVKSLKIPYSVSNDIVSELSERLYFKIGAGAVYNNNGTSVTIGDGDANIKINASDPVLSIHGGLLVDEGDYSTSYLELSHAVNFDVIVEVSTYLGTYKQANYLGEAGDYKGLVDRLVAIPAGQTKALVPILTYQNNDPNDWKYESTEIRIEASSLPVGVLLGQYSDIVTIADVAIPPPVVLPTLTLYDGGLAFEGGASGSYAELSDPVDHDVTFKVSTYFGTYQQANYLGEGGDYDGLIDKLFVIEAGKRRVDIPVQIIQNPDPADWEYEAFELRIEANTVSGATLDVGSVIINIKDVANWTPPVETPLTQVMLQDYANLFSGLESEVGTSDAASIIGGNLELSNVGKTLDVFGLLSSGIKNAVNWFAGSVAYASEETMCQFDFAKNKINMGLRLQSRLDSDQVATEPVYWTATEVEQTDSLGLRVGDYVDGRLVIHQPWMALEADGSYVSSSSLQGRYVGADNLSHKGFISNSFDWSGVSKYAVVPTDSYVVFSDDTGDTGGFNNGLGNFVTLKTVAKTADGKDIYLTFAHLKQGTVSSIFKQSSAVPIPTGTIIGETGQTGATETVKYTPYGYPVHLHMQAGTTLENLFENKYADADKDTIPPVYMLGFNKANVATLQQLGSNGSTANQDYGFPIGDWDEGDGNYVAFNIKPTIPAQTFLDLNFGQGGDLTTPSEVVNGNTDDDLFVASAGDHTYLGKEGFDEIHFYGDGSNISNFTFSRLSDGSTRVESPIFGTDILTSVEGIYFGQSNIWKLVSDLILDETENGTIGDDVFTASLGNDTYNGGQGFDEISFFGPESLVSNFTFTQNPDSSVTVVSPYGTDTLNSIEGVWFGASVEWHSVNSLIV